ncbi:MAG: TolC family outer membrane protein [Burkholderiaceae bacterium]
MTVFRLLPLSLALSTVLSASVQAQSLVDLYESARAFDAAYQAAKSQFNANLAKADQARAGTLPTVNLSANANQSSFHNSASTPTDRDFGNRTMGVTAVQPLYRPANWLTFEQGKKQSLLAQAVLSTAEQDLIVRVSQSYFDVLASQDSLTFVLAQKAAVAEQLASAKRNFEVGTSTITDTREAQARHDLVVAQQIAAENDLRVKKIALDQLTGKAEAQPKPLKLPLVLAPLPADTVGNWVARSEQAHPAIQQALLNLDVAKLETQKAEAGHKPTLDLNGSFSGTQNVSGSTTLPTGNRTSIGTLGLSLNLPLFAGYALQNRVRETLALEDKARNDLEASKRTVAQATRTAFYGVLSGQGQVKALEAAEASSQSALDANKLGYQVGVRINIDVLNSQSQLFQTKRDLAKARYDVLVGELKLRQANGSLQAGDLQAVNNLLN